MPLKPVSRSQDVSVIEKQGHITNRIRLAELSEQAIHWLNPLCSSWEDAVVLHSVQCIPAGGIFSAIWAYQRSTSWLMNQVSSCIYLVWQKMPENVTQCWKDECLFGVRLGPRACCDDAASWGRSTSRRNSAVVMVLQFFFYWAIMKLTSEHLKQTLILCTTEIYCMEYKYFYLSASETNARRP